MDAQFVATREDLYHVQMDVKHVQAVQNHHAERLARLEKRQADDAALKSVWGVESPFPSVLSGTPQPGASNSHSAHMFDDFDQDRGQTLLGGLPLEADGDPVRRGASRANSVRFDISALQGSGWTQGSRSSSEFVPVRPSSGFENHAMERTLSHKSDGRYSSTGQSVQSLHSGRTSSLGLDTNFTVGADDDDDDVAVASSRPPPGLFVLGSVPSIIRCWLTTDYSHNSLLYAVVCTGSQRSLVDISLVNELGLDDQISKDENGRDSIRLPVYLPEAIITQPSSRSSSPAPRIPALSADFEVTGSMTRSNPGTRRIRICLGSDTLRAHNADILFSQNLLSLFSDDRNKLSIPFVRPEDEQVFRNLRTLTYSPTNELKATASVFTPKERPEAAEPSRGTSHNTEVEVAKSDTKSPSYTTQPMSGTHQDSTDAGVSVSASHGELFSNHESAISPRRVLEAVHVDHTVRDMPAPRQTSPWGSWRQGGQPGGEGSRENEPFVPSSYQKPSRSIKNMRVLKPAKPAGVVAPSQGSRSSSGVRTGAAYEPAPQRSTADLRRKNGTSNSINGVSTESGGRWERERERDQRVVSDELRTPAASTKTTGSSESAVGRSSTNPIGGASAFAWMNSSKPRTSVGGQD